MRQTLTRMVTVFAVLLTVGFAVVVVNQTAQLVELAARLHPVAGQVVMWGLLGLFAACIVAPVALWLRLPAPLVPPAGDDPREVEAHLARLRSRLAANPRLADVPLAGRDGVEAAMARLDGDAEEVVRAAARRVFLTTAVSQNGALDALLVLGLQCRLIWDVAHVYAQRTPLRETAWLYANVLGTALVAAEIEDVELSERIQPVVQSVVGSAAGSIPGFQAASSIFIASVMSGTANAYLTLRVGIIASRYCGSVTRPEHRALRRAAFTEAARMLGGIALEGSRSLAAALVKASGRTVGSAVAGIGGRMRAAGGAMVDRLPFARGPAGRAGQPGTPPE